MSKATDPVYESGYPKPVDSDKTITIGEMEFEPGDQFRFPTGTDPLTREQQYGLCYVLNVDDEDETSVEFFNVTQESIVTHNIEELRDEVSRDRLIKLDEKW